MDLLEGRPTKWRRLMFKLHRRKKLIRIWFKYHTMVIKNSKGKHLIHMLTRKCEMCQRHKSLSLKHSNCAYVDELSNYSYLCKDCHQDVNDHYQELWDDYYSSRF